MSKVRDKLRALTAPRPTDVPEGASVALEQAPPPRDALEQAPPPRDALEQAPPPRDALPPQPSSVAARRPAPSPIPHVERFPRERTTQVRVGDLVAWRAARRGAGVSAAGAAGSASQFPDKASALGTSAAPAAKATLAAAAPKVSTAESCLAFGQRAWAERDVASASEALERALDAGLEGHRWWAAARLLAEVYLAADRADDARYVLEEMIDRPSSDPYPYLALAALVESESASRAAELRARARAIAPWC